MDGILLSSVGLASSALISPVHIYSPGWRKALWEFPGTSLWLRDGVGRGFSHLAAKSPGTSLLRVLLKNAAQYPQGSNPGGSIRSRAH